MKKWLFCTMTLLILFLSACTPRIYGVPEDRWEAMSEQERIAAMEAYQARQEALRQQRQEQARLRAMEKEAQLAREAEEARRRQLKVDAVYRGEGLYGDLLRVKLEGGQLQFYGHHRAYHPVAFRIAASEIKEVEIVSEESQRARMMVQYDGGNLLLDERPNSSRSNALRIAYDDAWQAGTTYSRQRAMGPMEMRGVDVTVQIVGQPPRDHSGRRHRHRAIPVRSRRQKPEKPMVIVIKEPRPQPEVVVIERPVHPKRPDVIVVKPEPYVDRPGKVIKRRPKLKKIAGKEGAGPPEQIHVEFCKAPAKKRGRRQIHDDQGIVLSRGDVQNVLIKRQKGNLRIQVSYLDGELLINDTPGRKKKHFRIGFAPAWKEGQWYAVAGEGVRPLEELEIFVKAD